MTTMPVELSLSRTAPASPRKSGNDPDRLEQAFLEEMLKYCGPKPSDGSFSGGSGEEHMSTFLSREYAAMLAGRLDLGLIRPEASDA